MSIVYCINNNRFIDLNETQIKYSVKTDENSAPAQRTHRTLHGL